MAKELTVDVDKLADKIAKELSKYSQDVVEKINTSSEKVGKAAVDKLKATSPRRTGKYASGWAMKTEQAVGQPHRRIVYNKTKPQLTHLLEHGHAKRGGGRVEGKPHIRPAEEAVINDFVREVEEAIQHG